MVQVPFFILRTYRQGDFYVDICAVDEFEAWLYHKDYGVKSFMFGLPFETGLDTFVEVVEKNLQREIDSYSEEYMDERS